MKRLFLLVSMLPASLPVGAAEFAASGPSLPGTLQVVVALLFVLGLIFFLAFMLRRGNFMPSRGRQVINILASMPIGNKERLMLLQVGDDQILVSQGQGAIRKIHTLTTNIDLPESEIPEQGVGFQGILASIMERKD